MYYVLYNVQNEEYLIISYDDYRECKLNLDSIIDNNSIFAHYVRIFAASYDKCLKYCEERIGYKE